MEKLEQLQQIMAWSNTVVSNNPDIVNHFFDGASVEGYITTKDFINFINRDSSNPTDHDSVLPIFQRFNIKPGKKYDYQTFKVLAERILSMLNFEIDYYNPLSYLSGIVKFIFNYFDINNDGKVTFDEMKFVFKTFGREYGKRHVRKVFDFLGKEYHEAITHQELVLFTRGFLSQGFLMLSEMFRVEEDE